MKTILALSLFAAIIAMSGCKTEDFQDTGELSIDDFYIVGSNGNSTDEIPVIDPYLNDGEFLIFIQTGKPDLGYTLTYYVSNRQSTEDATPIFNIDCDDDDRSCYDGNYFVLNCNFLTDVSGQCRNQQFDLSNSLHVIPYSGYIIAELCHRVQNQCVISSERVIFR